MLRVAAPGYGLLRSERVVVTDIGVTWEPNAPMAVMASDDAGVPLSRFNHIATIRTSEPLFSSGEALGRPLWRTAVMRQSPVTTSMEKDYARSSGLESSRTVISSMTLHDETTRIPSMTQPHFQPHTLGRLSDPTVRRSLSTFLSADGVACASSTLQPCLSVILEIGLLGAGVTVDP